jgi:hypothetical protein
MTNQNDDDWMRHFNRHYIPKNEAIAEDGLNAYQRRQKAVELLLERGIMASAMSGPEDREITLNATVTITGRDRTVSVLFSPNAMAYGLIETMLSLNEEESEQLDIESEDIERWNTLDEFINVIVRLQGLYLGG